MCLLSIYLSEDLFSGSRSDSWQQQTYQLLCQLSRCHERIVMFYLLGPALLCPLSYLGYSPPLLCTGSTQVSPEPVCLFMFLFPSSLSFLRLSLPCLLSCPLGPHLTDFVLAVRRLWTSPSLSLSLSLLIYIPIPNRTTGPGIFLWTILFIYSHTHPRLLLRVDQAEDFDFGCPGWNCFTLQSRSEWPRVSCTAGKTCQYQYIHCDTCNRKTAVK